MISYRAGNPQTPAGVLVGALEDELMHRHATAVRWKAKSQLLAFWLRRRRPQRLLADLGTGPKPCFGHSPTCIR